MSVSSINWISYFVGALLILSSKLIRYVAGAGKNGKTKKQAILEWFFEDTNSNYSSWITTIGAVWLGGYLYINQVESFLGQALPKIPVAAPVSFVLGCLMEMVAPNIVKLVVSKLPFLNK